MSLSSVILLGQYRPGVSFFHTLDTRAKILPVLVFMVLAVVTHSVAFYVVSLVLLTAGLLVSGIGPGYIARNLRPIVLLAVITIIFHLLFTGRDGETAFNLWGYAVSREAVGAGLFFSLRLLLFVMAAFLVTFTSDPSQLARAFIRLLSPLKRLKLPIEEIGLMLFIALRFIPILYEEFTAIRNAQHVRGVRFNGPLRQRARNSLALLIPAFVLSLNRAEELARAIEARGYRVGQKRTCYDCESMEMADGIFLMLGSGLPVALFILTG